MNMKKFILAFVAAVVVFSGCGERKKALLPNVSGKAGEVLVVMEKADWGLPEMPSVTPLPVIALSFRRGNRSTLLCL